MKAGRLGSSASKWLGVTAALTAAIAAVWLLSVYLHAGRVLPVEKAFVESLKEKAKTDAEVQKVLQPETDRQHEAAVARRNAYRRGGLVLLFASAVFLVWAKWLRAAQPNDGAKVGPRPKTAPGVPGTDACAATHGALCRRGEGACDRYFARRRHHPRRRGRPRHGDPDHAGHSGALPLSPGCRAAARVRDDVDHSGADRRRGLILRTVPPASHGRAHGAGLRGDGVPRVRRS